MPERPLPPAGLAIPARIIFIHNEARRSRRQDLQRLQELDHGILVGWAQRLERATRLRRLAVVRQHRLAHGRVLTVMAEGMLVGDAPELAGDEFTIAGEELGR